MTQPDCAKQRSDINQSLIKKLLPQEHTKHFLEKLDSRVNVYRQEFNTIKAIPVQISDGCQRRTKARVMAIEFCTLVILHLAADDLLRLSS